MVSGRQPYALHIAPMIERRALLTALLLTALVPQGASAAGDKKKEVESKSAFIELPTLTAAVMGTDGRRGVLTVQATLYSADPVFRTKINKSMPLLMNAYVPAMQAWSYRLPPGRTPNVEGLAMGLQQATDKIVGSGARLLLGGVMVN